MNGLRRQRNLVLHYRRQTALKRERIRRRTYQTREDARQDVFDYIEKFYNPVPKQVTNGMLSPVEFERQQIFEAEAVQRSKDTQKLQISDVPSNLTQQRTSF